ncbi:S1 family peptidase [Streptomyces sp. NPDC001663]|uniref:S1 family peptidase n=1 Tax=Streptomyces sp. NPDC001663 TaxID=3364597 RepID=UPI0036AF194D
MEFTQVRHDRKRPTQLLLAALLVAAAAVSPASADDGPRQLVDPGQAAALAARLGDDRTGGVYYRDGRAVVAVTDAAAAQSVRDAGGVPKLVTRSTAELASIQGEFDELAGIPNTAWGVEADSNQVSVEIFDGVSDADRARIEEVAAAHPGAVRIDRVGGKLETATTLRGGNGITSSGWLCSAAFNTHNSSGAVYTLTAGHCVPGTGNVWYVDADGTRIGTQTAYRFGASPQHCDSASRACDWATIKVDNPNLTTPGTIHYGGGTNAQIDNSRYPAEDEAVRRIGVTSQDLVGNVTKSSTTVTYADGTTLYGMIETSLCAKGGDSGGALFTGKTALGITSGGNYLDKPCGDSDGQSDRESFYTPVQTVLNERGLHVY